MSEPKRPILNYAWTDLRRGVPSRTARPCSECGHPTAYHRNRHGACRECDCGEYRRLETAA